MSIVDLLYRLRDLDVELWFEGDRLRFSAPDGVVTPELRAELVERKAEIVAFLREAQGATTSTAPPIVPVMGEDDLPLSFAQQRMWFLHQWEPGSAAYNIFRALRMVGPLDVSALQQTFNEIVRRHQVLQMLYLMVDDKPTLAFHPDPTLTLETVDLSVFPAEEREAEVQRWAAEEASRPFDLARDLPIRISLLRLGQADSESGRRDAHVLLLTMHHIASDGWSVANVLIEEMAVLYEAFREGKPSPLPELSIQYADFAHWQREWLQGEALEPQMAYWKAQLAGPPAVLDLPTDRPRPPIQTFCGDKYKFCLSPAVTRAVQDLSQREGVTPFMVLMAAFGVLLFRYTHQADVVVGTPIANRNRFEIEKLIGFFVNTLAIRVNFSGDPTVRELLQQVRETTLGAYDHQDIPFEKLVQELQLQRDLSRNPLFQVMFVLQNMPTSCATFTSLTSSILSLKSGTSRFDLTLFLFQVEDQLRGTAEYNTDLFDAATIQRMMAHFECLLESLVVDLEQRLSDLVFLTDAERRQLLVEWNDTKSPYPRQVCIHELFEDQAARTPDQVAVRYQGERLTYSELNRRANCLARYLRRLGVGPEVLVGVCLDRSPEMIVGLLGVLKAGGAYLPLDPAHPRERLSFMLKDAQAPVLLAQARLQGDIPQGSWQVICLDTQRAEIDRESDESLNGFVSADNLAYVIYTSGSTGRPKGVQVLHRALVNFIVAMSRRPGLTAEDVLLSVTTLSFDIAGLEIWLPLMVGAVVELVSYEEAADGRLLAARLAASGATVMQATPVTWQLLLAAGWSGDDRLRVLCGGEALPRELANRLRDKVPALWNMYGPTETTVWSSIQPVEVGERPVTIGRPIANTQMYVLDDRLHPLPVGVAGELYIGGGGLARGYLGRPALTATKFIPHPFSDEPGERLYNTGDLVRYRPDGTIEYLSRTDHQVKIRGFRIELSEIEAALAQHAAVQMTAVLARDAASPWDRRLVAYVVPAGEAAATTSELRGFLRQRLPDYMVPSAFVTLEVMPLTSSGKIDRRALPAVEGERPELEQSFVAPGTPYEEILAEVWMALLNLDQVGVRDNFFELGGHSLLATQVMSRVRDRFEIDLPVRVLFEAPTISELALRVEQALVEEIQALDEAQLSLLLES